MYAHLRLAIIGILIAVSLAINQSGGRINVPASRASVFNFRVWQAANFAVSELGPGHSLLWIRRYTWSQVRLFRKTKKER